MRIIEGDVNVVNAMLFGGTSPAMRDLIAQEHNAFIQSAAPSWGSRLLQRTNEIFGSFNGAGVLSMVDKALNKISAIEKPDAVYYFDRLEDFQSAKPMMQSYIMANKVVRTAYHRGLCDGYSDTYVDPSPGIVGFGHQAYMHVMDGVLEATDSRGKVIPFRRIKEAEEVNLSNFSAAHIGPDQMALDVVGKGKILNTWANLERKFEEGEDDPVNAWGGKL